MANSKRRPAVHLQGETGISVTKAALPRHWVVRELNPDYGLDLHVELFGDIAGEEESWETLGEHVFMQVKTDTKLRTTSIRPFSGRELGARYNTTGSDLDEDESLNKIEVVSYSLEVEMIETARRMGAAIPVILIVVDMSSLVPYFICLSDWIAKVLPIFKPRWSEQRSVTVHIPATNILDENLAELYIGSLAKRPKLYSAFSHFSRQSYEIKFLTKDVELAFDDRGEAIPEVAGLKTVSELYASMNESLDVWSIETRLGLIAIIHQQFGQIMALVESISGESDFVTCESEWVFLIVKLQQIDALWDSIAAASGTYDLLVRNHFLPTQLGQLLP